MEPTNKQGQKVRFIRVKGKVVPIRADKYKGQKASGGKPNKFGIKKGHDGAMKEQKIKSHYEEKADKKSGVMKWGLASVGGLLGSVVADAKGKKGLATALFAAGIGAAVIGTRKKRAALKSYEGEENKALKKHGASDESERKARYEAGQNAWRKTKRGQQVMAGIQKRKEAEGKPLSKGQIAYSKRAEKEALKNAEFYKKSGNSLHEDKWRRTAASHRKKHTTGF